MESIVYKEHMARGVSVAVRLEPGLVDRIDALCAELSARAAGTHVGRSDVIRIALDRGVDALEKEIKSKSKSRR